MDKIPMTVSGYSALEAELKRRQQEERPRIIQAIAEARSHGDLSENAEYHAAKEAQSHNEGRIAELEDKLSRAEVIDVSKLSGDTVKFGATVTLVDEDTDEEEVLPDRRRERGRRQKRQSLDHFADRPCPHLEKGRRYGRGQYAGRRQELRDPENRVPLSRAGSAEACEPSRRSRDASLET